MPEARLPYLSPGTHKLGELEAKQEEEYSKTKDSGFVRGALINLA